jgi:hypothetical protein
MAEKEGEEEEGNRHCNICGVECSLECGKCHAAYYCSVEHQKQEWKTHKLKCKRIRCVRDDEEDSDFTFEYTGNIDDKWDQNVDFSYSKLMSKKDKKAVMGDDDRVAQETIERLQREMYRDNKESLNTLREWRCCRDPTPSLVRPSCCGGAKAIGVVMWYSKAHIKLYTKMKKVICNMPYGIFPLCTECIKKNYDNDQLANTGKGNGIGLQCLY